MRRTLGAKNKLCFVDGSMEIPAIDDLNRSAWERCNHLIHSWIINSVIEAITPTLVFHENAIDAWEDLKERFSKADRIRIATLRTHINNLKQGTKSVLHYFTELRTQWEELNSHSPMPNCTCIHQCRCQSMRLAKSYRVEDQVIQFITGLNESFSIVKTQILLMDPLPPINRVYSLVIQEESNNSSISTSLSIDEIPVLANASDAKKVPYRGKGPSNGTNSKNSSRFCTHCNKNGHTIDFCYQKHGHPNFNKGSSSANSTNVDTQEASDNHTNAENTSQASNTGLTQEKYDQLISLIQQANLFPSVNPAPSSNHINTSPMISSNFASVSGFELQEDDWFG